MNEDFLENIESYEQDTSMQTSSSCISMRPDIDFNEITLTEKVGHGSYGTVYKAQWGKQIVAVKEFNIEADPKAIETEVKQLSRVRHSNIIALYGISSDQTVKYLIMEYAEGGSLHTFLHGHVKPYYTTPHAMSWAKQCAEGVEYLHAMKPKPLIHRDLKPLNLLLTNKGRCIKICDFGTVADKATFMTNNKGSAAWMAPEVFEGSKYTEKCDIFSWGIILWEVLSRQQPFKEIDNTYQLLWSIHKGTRPEILPGCPDLIVQLMTKCWATKPEDRPSMQYVVEVMRQFMIGVHKANEPLEYVFENQQITITSQSNRLEGNTYILDFNDFSNNPLASISKNNLSQSPNVVRSFLGQTMEIPQASIITTPLWEAIPEESDFGDHTPTRESSTIFNLTPSAESALRIETIRNGITQTASKPMDCLIIDTDPNAWELSSCDLIAKKEGNEHLTIIENKPFLTTKLPNNTLDGSSTNSLSDDNEDQDEVDESTDQSLVNMLDPEFQPESPMSGNPESLAIYRDHQRLAKEFLGINEEIVYAHALKNNILSKMDAEERRKKEEYLRKLKEKEELMVLYKTLKSQVLNQYHQGAMSISGCGTAGFNQDGDGASSANDILNDGWVFIQNNQNS